MNITNQSSRFFHALLLAVLIALGSTAVLSTTGCMKATTANIPGSVNNADAQLYVAVSDLQAAIEAAKQQVPAHPALRDVLNNNIGPNYQRAKDAYVAYHTALVNGAPADASKAAVITQQIAAVQQALNAALKSAGAK